MRMKCLVVLFSVAVVAACSSPCAAQESGGAKDSAAAQAKDDIKALIVRFSSGSDDDRRAARESFYKASPQDRVDALIESLADESVAVRIEALKMLRASRDKKAVPATVKLLKDDPVWSVRAEAAETLGGLHSTAAIKPLRAAMLDADESVRLAAIGAVIKTDPNGSLGVMSYCLTSKNGAVIAAAIMAWPETTAPDESLVIAITSFLDHDNLLAQKAAVMLGNMGDPSSAAAIEAALAKPGTWIRFAGFNALVKLRGQDAADTLVKMLQSDTSSRRQILSALLRIHAPQARDAVIATLADSDRDVRRKACMLLASYEDPLALDPLRFVAGTDSDADVRCAAAFALGVIGGQDEVATLIAMVNSEAPPTAEPADAPAPIGRPGKPTPQEIAEAAESQARCQALTSLAIIGGPKAIDAIAHAMDDPQEAVRGHAMALLAEIGDARALDRVISGLADKSFYVATDAVWASEFCEDPKVVQGLIDLINSGRNDNLTTIRHILGESLHPTWPQKAGFELRKAAMAVLTRKWPEQAKPVLLARLSDADPLVAALAAYNLAAIGDASEPVIAGLTGLMKNISDPRVRPYVGVALCKLKAKSAFDSCMDVLQNERNDSLIKAMAPLAAASFIGELDAELKNPRGRHGAALTVLGQVGSAQPQLADTVMSFLDSDDASVRQAAVAAIGGIRHAAAVDTLLKLLDGPEDLVPPAATALGEIGDKAAVPALLAALTKYESDGQATFAIAMALGRIGDKRAVAPLMRVARANWTAVEGLALLGDKQAVPVLRRLLYGDRPVENLFSGDHPVRPLDIAKAIFSLQADAGVEALGAVMRSSRAHSSQRECIEAVGMLAQVGSSEAIAYIRLAMRDSNRDVRQAARKALKTLSTTKPASGPAPAPSSGAAATRPS